MALSESDQQIIRYLLNELGEEELSMMEERLLTDTAFFELIASVEDELIMQYVRGNMEEGLRRRFEKIYLETPERRARVESARQLRAAVKEVASSRSTKILPAFFAARGIQISLMALVLAIGIGSWKIWRGNIADVHSVPQQTQISVVLEPGRVRSGASQQLDSVFALPPSIREVHFFLKTSGVVPNARYQVLVGTPERPGVFQGQAQFENGTVSITVPANLLTVGDYTLELQSVIPNSNPQTVATYYFRSAR